MKPWTVCLLGILMSACANSGANECSWVRVITLDQADVLSQPTKRRVLSHNLKVQDFCRRD